MKSFRQFKTQINELFDRPAQWRLVLYDDDLWVYVANINDKKLQVNFQLSNDDIWVVTFSIDGDLAITGEGDEIKIFSTVLDVMKDFIQREVPQDLYFTAAKTPESNNSRIKLYTRLIKRFARDHGYRLVRTDDGREEVGYTLVRV